MLYYRLHWRVEEFAQSGVKIINLCAQSPTPLGYFSTNEKIAQEKVKMTGINYPSPLNQYPILK